VIILSRFHQIEALLCENDFLQYSFPVFATLAFSSKVDRFTSKQGQNDRRPTLRISTNSFHQRKCIVLWW